MDQTYDPEQKGFQWGGGGVGDLDIVHLLLDKGIKVGTYVSGP